MTTAEERRRVDMGYDGPSDYSSTLARISAWSSAAGMQTYPENAPDTLLLGGEVLVLDVALLPEPTVHASYAGSAAEGRHCPAMDAFFSRLVSDVTKGGNGRRLRDALEYMMRLDKLAKREGNAGARWFDEVDALAKDLSRFTQEEVVVLAQCVTLYLISCPSPSAFGSPDSRGVLGEELIRERTYLSQVNRLSGQPSVPLDVLLLRGHAMSLPYLHSPALCFLVYLSPRAYLSLQRSSPVTAALQLPSFDISSSHLYNCLNSDLSLPGVTRAALTLVPLPETSSTPADPLLSSQPSFPLVPTALGFTHNFPLPTGPDSGKYGWVLTFGKGIVMSQSRMLKIASVVQPHQQLSYTGTGPSLSFTTGGWVDMLVWVLELFGFLVNVYGYLVEPRRVIDSGALYGHICAYSDSKGNLSPTLIS